jgi:AcrR family transcriptional regulator
MVGEAVKNASANVAALKPESRRDRHRRELVDQLCHEARTQLAAGGPGSVTWRGLARSVGMSPASLYTYFDGLDELFTELILRTYADLAQATEAAERAHRDRPLGDRILVGPLAYRRWALDHRAEFNLIFTDQLPGFVAEPGGPTVDAQVAVFRPISRPIAQVAGTSFDDESAESRDRQLQPFLGLWGLFHGLVSLEVNHHLDWLDAAAGFESRVRWGIESMGWPPASAGCVEQFESWVAGTS